MRASRGLKWENKMYKLKRSIHEIPLATKEIWCSAWPLMRASRPNSYLRPAMAASFSPAEGVHQVERLLRTRATLLAFSIVL